MTLGLLLKFVAAMLDLMIPYMLEKIIDDVAPTGSRAMIFAYGGIMVGFAVASAVVNLTANRLATKNSGKVTLKLRHDLFDRIARLSSAQTDRYTLPTLISRLTSDTYYVNDMLVRVQRIGIRGPILLIGGIVITITLDPVLTLVLAAMLPLIAVTVWLVTKFSVPLYQKCQKILDRLVCVVQENALGVRVIKALSKTEYERQRFNDVNTRHNAAERKAGAIMAVTNPTSTLVLNIGLSFVVLAGAFRVDSGLTEIGTIIAFLSYFVIILNAMIGITRVFVVCSRGVASANRISEVLNEPDGLPILSDGSANNREESDYHIEFEDVCFSYNKIEPDIAHVSFALKRGQTLGIIGATGGGKTTIANLLIRFYDPDSGCVRINGRDVRSIPKKELAGMFGVAFQNDFIMAASVRDNISFGRELSDFETARAISIAQAENIVSEYEDGASHMLTAHGTNISGGQRQRILIARAVAGAPDILILDDASSALDYATDAQLNRAIRNGLPNTTKVLIAQRVSSIMHADVIIMIDDGRVTGMGTHAQLIESCAEYRDIANTQMGGEAYAT